MTFLFNNSLVTSINFSPNDTSSWNRLITTFLTSTLSGYSLGTPTIPENFGLTICSSLDFCCGCDFRSRIFNTVLEVSLPTQSTPYSIDSMPSILFISLMISSSDK